MELFGTVIDSVSKKPVEDAEITLSVINEELVKEPDKEQAKELAKELAVCVTGKEGKFVHREVDQYFDKTLIYKIEKKGYKPLEDSIKIKDVKVTLDIELTGEDIELKLRFKDEIQNTLKSAKIDLEIDGKKVGEGSSDEDGLFKIGLSPEYNGKKLSYKAELPGFEVASGEINLQKNNYHEITLRKPPEISIFGTVNDSARIETIPGAKISLYIGDKETTVVHSDDHGKYRYDKKGVQYLGETLRYRVEKDGYEPFERTRKIEQNKIQLDIELTSESPSLELTFKDQKTSTLLENVKVTLELEGKQVKVGVSDKKGLFKVTLSHDLKDKNLSYKAELAGFELSSGEVRLARETSREIVMVSSPVITISGNVEDTAGKPIPDAKVSLIVGDKEISVLRSDGKGKFYYEGKGGQYAGADLKYRVEKEGYKSEERSAKVQEGGARLAVTLNPTPVPTPTPTPSPKPIIPIVAGALVVVLIIAIWMFLPGGNPTIDKFEASPKVIGLHNGTTLSWAVSNAENVLLNDKKVNSSGNEKYYPTENTTYTLAAQKGDKKVDRKVIVVIEKPKEITIDKFEASPEIIGLNEGSTLKWAASNADRVLLNNEEVDPSGSRTVYPEVSTTYTLIAQRGDEKVDREIKVVVEKPKINYFEADYEMITTGESVNLKWNVDYAESVSLDIESGIGPSRSTEKSDVASSGTSTYHPKVTTDYTLKATSDGETDTKQIKVTVKKPATIVKFVAEPDAISSGETSTLSWGVNNADRILIDPDPGEEMVEASSMGIDPNGGYEQYRSGNAEVKPDADITYTLTAWNDDEGKKATEAVLAKATERVEVKVSPGFLYIPSYPIVALNHSIESP